MNSDNTGNTKLDSIYIHTGTKRIAINDDPSRVITFNPTDIIFAEKFYALIGEFETKLQEYGPQFSALEQDNTSDDHGIPVNMGERISLIKEICGYIRGKIDELFGEGSSQTIFGDAYKLEMIIQFFDGITPYIKSSRLTKASKYQFPTVERKTASHTRLKIKSNRKVR